MARLNQLKLLEELIAIPSVSGDDQVCKKIIHFARSKLTEEDIESRTVTRAGKPILLWGQLNLQESKWLINTHLDVVPATPAQFVTKITKDKIWGRGTADTKWASATLLSISKEQVELATSKNITFMLVVDEEIGGESTKVLLSEMKGLSGAIFLEPTQEKIVLEAKGIMQMKIIARGKTCHGSRPWEGINAIEMLVQDLATFRIRNPIPLSETKNTTFNFSTISGGQAINQVPDKAELWCDIRFNPHSKIEDVITQLQTCFGGCEVAVIKNESAIDCAKSALVVKNLSMAMRQNSKNPLFAFDHGSSDARHSTKLSIPSLVFGIKGKGLHSEEEWGSLKSIKKIGSILDTWISLL